jgi:hypothetical protein
MLITDRPPEVDDLLTTEMVAAILEPWSIEEVSQLMEEIEAEIARRKIN